MSSTGCSQPISENQISNDHSGMIFFLLLDLILKTEISNNTETCFMFQSKGYGDTFANRPGQSVYLKQQNLFDKAKAVLDNENGNKNSFSSMYGSIIKYL